MRFTTLTTAFLASCALAAPTPAPAASGKLAPNTATCSLEYQMFYGAYTVEVGRPYLNGKGCSYVKAAIKDKAEMTIKYKCEDNGHGQTRLTWKTDIATKGVNQGLQKTYPMIPFVAKNICNPYNP